MEERRLETAMGDMSMYFIRVLSSFESGVYLDEFSLINV